MIFKCFNFSELRLIEVLEEVCDRFLTYSVHAEREGSLRYSKGESQTMKTLKQLRFGNLLDLKNDLKYK
jgi:hypothetical protein